MVEALVIVVVLAVDQGNGGVISHSAVMIEVIVCGHGAAMVIVVRSAMMIMVMAVVVVGLVRSGHDGKHVC